MKKIVRLTEAKLVELIRGIVSEQEVNAYSPEEVKRRQDLNAYNSNLQDLKRKGKITPAQFMQKYNAVNDRKIKSPNEGIIPYVTSSKFLPPVINHDDEVTKPEPPEDDKPLDEQTARNAGQKKGFDYDLYVKIRDAYFDTKSDLESGKYKSNPKTQAAMVAKVKALEANYNKMRALMTIPKVTTTKFMPPEIKHDEEVTKPEPAPEPEEKPVYEPEPEPEIEEPVPPQLQESIKRTLRMFNRIK